MAHSMIGLHYCPGSNLLSPLKGVVVARNVRHDRTFIRFGGVDHICCLICLFLIENTIVLGKKWM